MPSLDRRILPDDLVAFLRECAVRAPFHLGGGVALGAAYLRHRLSNDLDLFCHDAAGHRELVRLLPEAARAVGGALRVARDAGGFVRAELGLGPRSVTLDVVHEPLPDLQAPAAPIEGIVVESLVDLRASKLACILSRSEPRDLVDLHFLDRAGHPPEHDLGIALRKDAGIDPAILAWLLGQFPVEPLPSMLEPLTVDELRRFRDDLRERMRRASVP